MKIRQLLIITGVFAIAMGFLEAAVVVYLRELYYPRGFYFPLKSMDVHVLMTEILREASTMMMLISVTLIAVRRPVTRFAVFIYMFAIWDIFYYIFLFLILCWPSSLLTWDILFLIPLVWTGPVLAPLINSVTMIALAVPLIRRSLPEPRFRVRYREWVLLIAGGIITVFAYIQPFGDYLMQNYDLGKIISGQSGNLMQYTAGFIPQTFCWWIFGAGELLFLWVIWSVTHDSHNA